MNLFLNDKSSLFASFCASSKAASWPTLSSMSYEAALYTNNLKNRFLTASGLPHNFCSHLRLASRQWSLAPNKNSEDPSCQIPDSSSCLCIT